MTMPKRQVQSLKFPLKGLNRRMGFQDGQGPYTTYDALNVRPTDTILERERGGSRPGLDTAYSTQLGSGNPVRFLERVSYIASDGFKEFIDDFEGNTMGSSWNQIGTSSLPLVTNNLVSISYQANGITALDLLSNFDTTSAYTAELYIEPYKGEHHGVYQIYLRMDDTTPVPTTDGCIAQITMTGTGGVATATLDKYESGVKTNIDTGTGTGTYAKAGWFSVTVSGDTVTMYWNGESIGTGDIGSTLTGTRVGFGVTCTQSGGICLIDTFRTQYFETTANERLRNILVASSNGVIYKDSTAQTMVSLGSSLTLASDRLILGAERGQKLYIADVGLAASGTDGVFASSVLTSASYADWTTIGANVNDYVVVISNGTSATTDGVYAISTIVGGNLTLASDPGDGGGSFRIERGTKVYDPSDDSVALWTATTAKGQIPQGCPLICRYRDRMVLAGSADNPTVWYMSRQGDPLDWDYSQEDPATAIAGTNADAGVPGEPILALITHSDDYLLMGCQNSLWVMRGDPAFGGQIDNLSENIGLVDKRAWCYGPEGQIIFLSRDGLYGLGAGASQYPQEISRAVLPQELRDISNTEFTVTMAYDIRERGIHIYLSSANVQTVTHWWFDWEQKSFWPVTLQGNFDPTSLLEYYSQDLRQSVVLLGGRDGYIRRYDPSFETDGGTQITSYVYYGPIRLGGKGLNEGNLVELQGTLGAGSGNVTWDVIVGDTMEAVSTASSFETGTWEAGDNYANHPRARGDAYVIKLSGAQSRRWAVEEVQAVIQTAGKSRKV